MSLAKLSVWMILFSVTASFAYCPSGWIKHKKKCYILFPDTERNSADKADQFCRQQGGTLMNLKTKELVSMALELAKARQNVHIFIGLNDKNTEDDFRWSDDEKPTFTMWLTGEPSSGTFLIEEDCVEISKERNGRWNDIPCTREYNGASLCEKAVEELIMVTPRKRKLCDSHRRVNQWIPEDTDHDRSFIET